MGKVVIEKQKLLPLAGGTDPQFGFSVSISDKYAIGKLNVDNNSDIATKYGIRSIPCLLFFKDGKVEKQIVGAIDKNEIADILESL